MCSPKDNLCIARGAATQCDGAGEFMQCNNQHGNFGIIYGACGSGGANWVACGLVSSTHCYNGAWTGMFCGYLGLGQIDEDNTDWQCQQRDSVNTLMVRDLSCSNNAMVVIY